ncbi:MAG: hypothetical protein KUG81_10780 [Gammaproteobacteria bacterium]|nr:hypothetical protein [Gammaproteobacteria bacterium]
MKFHILLIITCVATFSHTASALLIGEDTVDGRNSLYYDDWGHSYNTGSGNQFNAIGRGNPARAFEVGNNPYGFSSGDLLQIRASGCVVDAGSNCTAPDYMGGIFRALPVYSLIGLWSTNPTSIDPFELFSGVNPAFFIGGLLDIIVPDAISPLYLFMATNDGIFRDNRGAYSVRIDNITQVPTPPVIYLLLVGLVFLKRFVTRSA